MNELHSIQDYLNKIQDLYCESFFEKRMNSSSSDDRINEFQFMMEQINQDQGVIENLLEICQFLIGTLSIKQDEEQEQIDYHQKQKQQLEENLKTERDEVDQYKNLFQEKCQVIDEQLQIIQDLEFQNNFLKNQNTLLEKQSLQAQRELIDNDSITQVVFHQEEQLQRNANYISELEFKINKMKQELQAAKIEIENLKQQIKDLNKMNKTQQKELAQAKLSIQQQEALIQSLESDIKIQGEMVLDLQNQVSSYKDQLIQIHNLQLLNYQKESEKKTNSQDQLLQLQNSNFSQQVERVQRSDSQTQCQQPSQSLKIQLPLLSHRQPVFKFLIPEVSERHEQSESPQKNQVQLNENYSKISTFEVNQIDKENLQDRSISFQEQKLQEESVKFQPISQTARGKQVPKFQFQDLNNRITVAKSRKSKTIEQNGLSRYLENIRQTENFGIQTRNGNNPYQIFFDLLVQCEKINSEYFDDIYSVDTSKYFANCMKEALPYYEWQKWISNQLIRDLK